MSVAINSTRNRAGRFSTPNNAAWAHELLADYVLELPIIDRCIWLSQFQIRVRSEDAEKLREIISALHAKARNERAR